MSAMTAVIVAIRPVRWVPETQPMGDSVRRGRGNQSPGRDEDLWAGSALAPLFVRC